jgi:hypothetical protein
MTTEQLAFTDIMALEDEGELGYIFDVTLHCPNDHRIFHDPLPPAVVRRSVTYEELSAKDLYLTSIERKTLVYHKLLKIYMAMGILAEKIHKGLAKQKAFLLYISLATRFFIRTT